MTTVPSPENEGDPILHGPDGIQSYWMFVTPERAGGLLEWNTRNRNLSKRKAAQIARDQQANRYHVTHQGIAFYEDGTLADGQTRLYGITLSGKGQWLMVTEGLSEEAMHVIDKGRRRSVADSLLLTGHSYTKLIATAALYSIAVETAARENGGLVSGATIGAALSASPASPQEQLAYALVHEDRFLAYANLAGRAGKAAHYVAPSPLLVAARFFPGIAAEFLAGMDTLEGLYAGDPRRALVRYKGDAVLAKSRANMILLPLKAMSAYQDGRKIDTLRYSPHEQIRIDLDDDE